MNINYESNPGSCGRKRLRYGATPLKPWAVSDYGDAAEFYGQASIRRISEIVESNEKLIQPPTTPPEVTARLAAQALQSNLGIHLQRVGHHNDNPAVLQYHNQEVLLAAEQGKATPKEMFQILIAKPEMEAVELAKFS